MVVQELSVSMATRAVVIDSLPVWHHHRERGLWFLYACNIHLIKMGLENHPCICSTTALQSIYVNVNSIQHSSWSVYEETVALLPVSCNRGGDKKRKMYTALFWLLKKKKKSFHWCSITMQIVSCFRIWIMTIGSKDGRTVTALLMCWWLTRENVLSLSWKFIN